MMPAIVVIALRSVLPFPRFRSLCRPRHLGCFQTLLAAVLLVLAVTMMMFAAVFACWMALVTAAALAG
eukprot:2411526-Pleurochrysis_carterae.AAC.2